MMMKRDLNIIKDLERFRVMSRDNIADLHFSHLKNPVTSANIVLKRLVRDKQIEASESFSPYVYFPHGSAIKRNSTKIPHFLKIVDVYKQLKQTTNIESFIIEPKFEKGAAEPDVMATIKNTPFFIEIQRNIYSQSVMDKKMKRYETLKYSDIFSGSKFPFVIMITNTRYAIHSDVITVFQVESINEFLNNANHTREKQKGITYKIG